MSAYFTSVLPLIAAIAGALLAMVANTRLERRRVQIRWDEQILGISVELITQAHKLLGFVDDETLHDPAQAGEEYINESADEFNLRTVRLSLIAPKAMTEAAVKMVDAVLHVATVDPSGSEFPRKRSAANTAVDALIAAARDSIEARK